MIVDIRRIRHDRDGYHGSALVHHDQVPFDGKPEHLLNRMVHRGEIRSWRRVLQEDGRQATHNGGLLFTVYPAHENPARPGDHRHGHILAIWTEVL